MKKSTQIGLSVGGAIAVSLIGYGLAGLGGCIFGFIGTLLLIGLFHIWIKYY